jgi:hypothetical protein
MIEVEDADRIRCQAKDCMRIATETTIFHLHNPYDRCNPYDQEAHHIYELCRYHNRIITKQGENRVMLKDEYYV